jgi:hypothetical protein
VTGQEELDFSADSCLIVNEGHCKNCNRAGPKGKNSNLDRDAACNGWPVRYAAKGVRILRVPN